MDKKKNKIKMLVEIFIIVIAISYLLTNVINKNNYMVFYLIMLFITGTEMFFNNLTTSFSKISIKKVPYILLSLLGLASITFILTYVLKTKYSFVTPVIKYEGIVISIYLLALSIINIIKMFNEEKLAKSIFTSLFSLLLLAVIVQTYLFMI